MLSQALTQRKYTPTCIYVNVMTVKTQIDVYTSVLIWTQWNSQWPLSTCTHLQQHTRGKCLSKELNEVPKELPWEASKNGTSSSIHKWGFADTLEQLHEAPLNRPLQSSLGASHRSTFKWSFARNPMPALQSTLKELNKTPLNRALQSTPKWTSTKHLRFNCKLGLNIR